MSRAELDLAVRDPERPHDVQVRPVENGQSGRPVDEPADLGAPGDLAAVAVLGLPGDLDPLVACVLTEPADPAGLGGGPGRVVGELALHRGQLAHDDDVEAPLAQTPQSGTPASGLDRVRLG